MIDVDVDTCVAGLHSGAGNVVYTGRAGLAFLYSAGMGPIDASGLEAEHVLVNNSGVIRYPLSRNPANGCADL